MVDSEMRVSVLPDTTESRTLFSSHAAQIFFHQAQIDGQAVKGYAVIPATDKKTYRATNVWTIAFPIGVEYVSILFSIALLASVTILFNDMCCCNLWLLYDESDLSSIITCNT
jgi:hypothetical protein